MSTSYFVSSTGEFTRIGWINTNSSKGIIGFEQTSIIAGAIAPSGISYFDQINAIASDDDDDD